MCSDARWSQREGDALTIKLNNELAKWEEAKQQADDAGDLSVWLSETENKRPTMGTRKKYPEPPKNPRQGSPCPLHVELCSP